MNHIYRYGLSIISINTVYKWVLYNTSITPYKKGGYEHYLEKRCEHE